MYTAFYGLRDKPFQLSPDPRFLFLADSHREALAHLLFGIEQGEGFIAVTGEVGTGKTTLCRTLLTRLDPGAEVAIIFNPQLSAAELLEAIHVELGLDPTGASRRELMERLNRFLLEKSEDGRRVLLIVDEAQTLGPDALEQLRMLSNLETESSKLIQIILLGQPEFDAMLESPSLRQLRQRISVRWRLTPLSAPETAEYVRHRLRIAAGARRELFGDAALRELYRRSAGIPRVVNLLCDRALLAGYAAGAQTISQSLVVQADQELRGGKKAPSLGPRTGRAVVLRRYAPLAGLLVAGVIVGVLLERGIGPEAPSANLPEPATAAAVPTESPATASKTPIRAVDVAADPIALTEIHERAPAAAAATAPEPLSSPGLIAGDELDRRLAQADPALGTAAALDAVLDAWGLAPAGAGSLTLDAAVVELQARGLAVYSADGADAGSLAGLGPLALVALRGPGGVDHAVLLDRVGVESVRVVGLLGDPTPVEVTREGFDTRVSGQARVVWRDFEGLPPVLRWGYRGPAVEWLQTSLRALGYLKTPATGEYDGATVAAVRAFQITRGLQADGEVGPRTKMALYTALATYPFPRLVQQGEVG